MAGDTKMTRTERAIKKVLIDVGVIEASSPDIKVCRTRAGHWQRADGAWSWWVALAENPGMEIAGSPFTCQEIIKAHQEDRLVVGATMTSPELYIKGYE